VLELVLVAGIIAWKAGPALAAVAVATVGVYGAFTIDNVPPPVPLLPPAG
jgi:ABC-type transport system involved in Fe-S cluster assembly fused permease/ATPase subunit